MTTESGLRREVTLVPLVLYGLGTTIGAGIYALTGEVAGEAGTHAPLAFVVAALLAAATGLSFAELAGRLPKAAGEAVFVRHAFGLPILSRIVGTAVVIAGLVAGAAITNAFGGYLSEVSDVTRDRLADSGVSMALFAERFDSIVAAYLQQEDVYGQCGWDMSFFGDESLIPVQIYRTPKTVEPAVNVR